MWSLPLVLPQVLPLVVLLVLLERTSNADILDILPPNNSPRSTCVGSLVLYQAESSTLIGPDPSRYLALTGGNLL